MGEVEDLFGDLIEPRPYPGKRKPVLRDQKPPAPPPSEAWDAHPRHKFIDGAKQEFFLIGHVALALNRSARSIRLWERKGIIPPATFRAAKPHHGTVVKSAGDRLWTRAQVEVMIRAAQETGVIDGKPPSKVFTAKVIRGFLALQQQHGNT